MMMSVVDRARSRVPRRDATGAVAVEMALVLVFILLPLLFGIMQYGLFFFAYQGGSDVTRDAARRAAVSTPVACTDFTTRVRNEIGGLRESTSSAATVTRTYAKGGGNTGTGVEVGDFVTVSVQFNSRDLGLPFVPLPNHGIVASTAQARVEYVTSPAPVSC